MSPLERSQHWDDLYRAQPDALPWETTRVPAEIKELVRMTQPGATALELGCGRGAHALFLARNGIAATGIDFSAAAIEQARRRALEARATARFVVGDVLGFRPTPPFDLVYDYSLLHHIQPSDLGRYTDTVRHALKPRGLYSVVCYSDTHPERTPEGWRTGRLGNRIWHRSVSELVRLFGHDLDLLRCRRTTLGRPGSEHDALHLLFQERTGQPSRL